MTGRKAHISRRQARDSASGHFAFSPATTTSGLSSTRHPCSTPPPVLLHRAPAPAPAPCANPLFEAASSASVPAGAVDLERRQNQN